jgi:hypothetical protein
MGMCIFNMRSMAKKTFIKISGTWKQVVRIWINVNGTTWKNQVVPWIKTDGVWKDCWAASILFTSPTEIGIVADAGSVWVQISSENAWTIATDNSGAVCDPASGNAGITDVEVAYDYNTFYTWYITATNTTTSETIVATVNQGFE